MSFSLPPLFIEVSFQRCQSICAHKMQRKVTKEILIGNKGPSFQNIKFFTRKKSLTLPFFPEKPWLNSQVSASFLFSGCYFISPTKEMSLKEEGFRQAPFLRATWRPSVFGCISSLLHH